MWMFVVLSLVASPCPDAVRPVPGPIIEGFAPVGDYAGHWGVDFAAAPGTEVGAVADGTISFAGPVAGRLSVSVDHGRGMVTTVSYLATVSVSRGERVSRGQTLGTSGTAHGIESIPLSLRIAGEYTDPTVLFSCRLGDISEALRLVPVPD